LQIVHRRRLPCTFDAECIEVCGFALVKIMFDDAIDATAARSFAKAGAQLVEIFLVPGGDNLHIAVFGVAHPSTQFQLACFATHEPAKPNPLHAALNEEVKYHDVRPKISFADANAQVQDWRRQGIPGDCENGLAMLDGGSRDTLNSSMVFVLDNYDSFTYNLVQYLGELGAEVVVRRNDEVTPEEVEAMKPERILLSPGPCTPHEAGILVPLIRHMAGKTPILGVCLGHQAIGEAFGGEVVRARNLMHGKTSSVQHNGKGIFAGLPTPLTCTRYHSLIVDEGSLPAELEVTARTGDGNGTGGTVIMGLRHRTLPVEGVQFHPESVLTEGGHRMIQNFLEM
jgi:anthranilate synthase/aminodeoxychorismate synthase-like glutamine amidotransferase